MNARLSRTSGDATVPVKMSGFSNSERIATRPGAVGVEREQTMFVSSGTVNRQAEGAYRQTLKQAQGKQRLNPDLAQTERVREIGYRLIATGEAHSHLVPSIRSEVRLATGEAASSKPFALGITHLST